MPPNRFESEVESFLEGSHGDRTHIKRADHHTVTPLCGTLLVSLVPSVGVRDPAVVPAVSYGAEPALSVVPLVSSEHGLCAATSSRVA